MVTVQHFDLISAAIGVNKALAGNSSPSITDRTETKTDGETSDQGLTTPLNTIESSAKRENARESGLRSFVDFGVIRLRREKISRGKVITRTPREKAFRTSHVTLFSVALSGISRKRDAKKFRNLRGIVSNGVQSENARKTARKKARGIKSEYSGRYGREDMVTFSWKKRRSKVSVLYNRGREAPLPVGGQPPNLRLELRKQGHRKRYPLSAGN